MSNPYQQVFNDLDICAALRTAKQPNDLLPPRHEDKVTGEVGKRFTGHLKHQLSTGQYDPTPAPIIAVPKSALATRPARLLTLADRVVYEALLAPLRSRIDDFLLGEDIVLWPRGTQSTRSWADFERIILDSNPAYVARADIAGFYETIGHDHLTSIITNATGRTDLARALIHFLGRVMGSRQGIPQGPISSDALASLYLAEVDFAMVRNGFRYARHGDDIRVAVATYEDGRAAVRCLESELRHRDLLLNSAKTRVLRAMTYSDEIARYEGAWERAKEEARSAALEALSADMDALETALRALDLNELRWELFYHETIGIEEAVEKLRPTLSPDAVPVAETMFLNVFDRRPTSETATEKLSGRTFYQQLKGTLAALSAVESRVAVPHAAELLSSFPETTVMICQYLRSLPDDSGSIVAQTERAMTVASMDWTLALLIRVLCDFPEHVSDATVAHVQELVEKPWHRWLAAVEATKFLAITNVLPRSALLRLWNTCPRVFRVDLVVAAVVLESSVTWAKAFVEAGASDPVHQVAIRHQRQLLGEPAGDE